MNKITKWAEKYLTILELPQESPSFDYLERICHSNLTTFPFENISKLIYFRDKEKNDFEIPPIEIFVDNFNEHDFGGTCYTQNSNLMYLLRELGFDCYHVMLGNEHMGIIVDLPNEDEKVYVDCGAAAPFFKPVRFEMDHLNTSEFGDDKVKLLPVSPNEGQYKYVRYTNGKQSGKVWEFDITKKCEFEDFSEVIQQANRPNTTFMTILRCQLWQTKLNRSVSLVNNQFGIRYSDGSISKHKLNSIDEIECVIANEFMLPKLPVRDALSVLNELNIDIFYEDN
jgi:N-hydroxyarylamine O-acetyltransferase